MAQQILKLGTRGSPLALTQAKLAAQAIEGIFPEVSVEINIVHTSGDKDRVRSLVSLGGSGVFVKELEEALIDGRIDFAVHSLKDVPENTDSRLTLAGFLKRAIPYDVLVSQNKKLSELPPHARIGTGSPRRVLQIKAIRPDVECVDLRGNLETRLQKVECSELDAIMLGGAGLSRLGLAEQITEIFSPQLVTPAIAQGIVALQCHREKSEICQILEAVTDKTAQIAANAERAWMNFLGGGCRVPIAAFLEPNTEFETTGFTFYAYLANPKTGVSFRDTLKLPPEFSLDTLFNFGNHFAAQCKCRDILLPKEVNEHALLDFWGKT